MERKEIALEDRGEAGARLFSPSAARNRDAIREAFLAHMPLRGRVLEIAAGTGEHAVHIAAAAPGLKWLPGDPDPASRASIAAWAAHEKLENIAPPHALDVTDERWTDELGQVEGIVCINMIHIAPFDAAKGLIEGAGRVLASGGKLFLYGPFSRGGAHTAPSNAEFDRSLKSRDPRWGVRDLEQEIAPLAARCGLALQHALPMPANNFTVIFARAARS